MLSTRMFTHRQSTHSKAQENFSVCVGELLLILIVPHTAWLSRQLLSPCAREAVLLASLGRAASLVSEHVSSLAAFSAVRLIRPPSLAEPSHHTLVRQHMSDVL